VTQDAIERNPSLYNSPKELLYCLISRELKSLGKFRNRLGYQPNSISKIHLIIVQQFVVRFRRHTKEHI